MSSDFLRLLPGVFLGESERKKLSVNEHVVWPRKLLRFFLWSGRDSCDNNLVETFDRETIFGRP